MSITLSPGELKEISPTLTPQLAALTGTVTDASTGAAIVGALVDVVGTGLSSTTDGNGFFTVTNIPPGTYTVRISAVGYETVEL